jgi:DeoR family transcriptional regulator, glycerol-3-phosphate regulon repressor
VDIAIIGTSAIDSSGTLLDFDVREVEISRAIIEHARKVVLVANSTKFWRSAPVRIAHLSEIGVPSNEIAKMCRLCDVEVIETGGPNELEAIEPQKLEAEFEEMRTAVFRLSRLKCSL